MTRSATFLVFVVLACGRTDLIRGSTMDASVSEDAGTVDAGFQVRDAGTDAGQRDASVPDAGIKPCINGRFSLSPAEPVVMIVLDRSGSMHDPFDVGGMITKWDALRNALRATLPVVDQRMQIGGLFFPLDGVDDCFVPSVAGVRPARGNVPILLTSLNIEPAGRTPTRDAVTVAADVLRARRTGSNARAMVLATDGEPTCTANPLGDALEALRSAARDGIPTYVIGIQTIDPNLISALDQMAIAGARPQPGVHGFYSCQSSAELQRAFTTIRDQVGACSFLSESVPDADGGISVTFGGLTVPYDESGTTGWRWTDRSNGEIELRGVECARAVAAPAQLNIVVSCSGR